MVGRKAETRRGTATSKLADGNEGEQELNTHQIKVLVLIVNSKVFQCLP